MAARKPREADKKRPGSHEGSRAIPPSIRGSNPRHRGHRSWIPTASALRYRGLDVPFALSSRGHPRLRMRHAPFAVTPAARDRWMELMMASVAEQQVAEEHRAYLERFLGDIATFLINRG